MLKALRPRFERALKAQGLVLINWAHTGWAHMFTADPVTNLQELKRTKLFTSAGDDRMVSVVQAEWLRPGSAGAE